MPTVMEAAYAAGLFDGEGHIDIADRARMAVKMTDRGPVYAMRDILGGRVYQWQDTSTGRPTYEWRASGVAGMMEAIDIIYEYALGKKRQLQVASNYHLYRETYGYDREVKQVASTQLRGLRIPAPQPVTWDLETMGLDSSTLPILTCSTLTGDDTSSVTAFVKTPGNEKQVIINIRDALEKAPYTIGWNSSRFDIPFLNTRLILHGERPAFLGSHDDASEIYKAFYGHKRRTSLEEAARQLGVTDENAHKTPIDWVKWNAANEGDPDAMSYVIQHGLNDVVLTKRTYNEVVEKR